LPAFGPIYLHKDTKRPDGSFVNRYARVPHLYNNWHYHRELELLYVIRGEGTRYVGDSIEPFFSGDLVLVGSNVPHFWQSDARYFAGDPTISAELVLTQFLPDLLGEGFTLSEFTAIRQLIARAQQGIKFGERARRHAGPLLLELTKEGGPGAARLLGLLHVLNFLALTDDYTLLSRIGHPSLLNDASTVRLRRVCSFLLDHYLEPIRLSEVAALANMSEKAFCRFFKRGTQKTLVQFVNDLRISHACKLLIAGQLSVSEVCFASGFNNLSHFNRMFKRTLGSSPQRYRGQMRRG
jgi:AraC-like DNA-binding protein